MPKRRTARGRKTVKSKKPAPRSRVNGRKAVDEREDTPVDLSALKKIFEEASRAEEVGPAIKWLDIECPYCGEELEIRVETTDEGQEMAEDCQVCARKISISVEVIDGEVLASAYRE